MQGMCIWSLTEIKIKTVVLALLARTWQHCTALLALCCGRYSEGRVSRVLLPQRPNIQHQHAAFCFCSSTICELQLVCLTCSQ